MIVENDVARDTETPASLFRFRAAAFREGATALALVAGVAVRQRQELYLVAHRRPLDRGAARARITVVRMGTDDDDAQRIFLCIEEDEGRGEADSDECQCDPNPVHGWRDDITRDTLVRMLWLVVVAVVGLTADWPQFRGVNAAGVADETNLPIEFGPETNVVWKTSLPMGPSSPSTAGDHIFLTGVEDERLFTFALDRTNGTILWRREAPRPRHQVLQENNHPASPTPATDGENVYVFFADFGLLAYGRDGDELWRLPLGPFNNPFGHGSSPIVVRDLVIQVCDQDDGAIMIAVDKATGTIRWRAERAHAQRGYATPVLYQPEGGELQVLVAGSYQHNAYDVATGELVWWLSGLPWQIKPTPVLTQDAVYFISRAGESDPGEQEIVRPFTQALEQLDDDRNGKLF